MDDRFTRLTKTSDLTITHDFGHCYNVFAAVGTFGSEWIGTLIKMKDGWAQGAFGEVQSKSGFKTRREAAIDLRDRTVDTYAGKDS